MVTSPEKAARSPADWHQLEGKQIPVRLRVPFASEWTRREVGNALRLEHPGESCEIAIRIWPTSRVVNVAQCFEQLALMDPHAEAMRAHFTSPSRNDPEDGTSEHVTESTFEPGGDFHGRLVAGVSSANHSRVDGTVVGVAAGIGRCASLVASTSCSTGDAAARVAERLAWLVEGVARTVAVRSVEERVN